jgi:hypothetical protein
MTPLGKIEAQAPPFRQWDFERGLSEMRTMGCRAEKSLGISLLLAHIAPFPENGA